MKVLTYDSRPKVGIPQKYLCEPSVDCGRCSNLGGWLKPDMMEEFRKWSEDNRPDLSPKIDGLKCHLEEELRVQRIEESKRLLMSNLPARNDRIGPRTFDNFNVSSDTKEMFEATRSMCSSVGPKHLLISGITGTGKTHMLEALSRQFLSDKLSVHYANALDLLDQLRGCINRNESVQHLMDWYRDVALLAIDEIGTDANVTEFGKDYLTAIVDHRYSDGSYMIAATNGVTPDEIAKKWGHRLASRLFDRSSGIVRVVWCDAKDYRLNE